MVMSCALTAWSAEVAPDFAKDVAPIFTKYCTGCHNDSDKEGKLSLESYAALLKGGAKGGVVTPGQAELSRMVRMLTGLTEPKMPPKGEESPKPAEIEVLKAWIGAGAKGPSGAAADPTMLVTPQVKLLAPAKLPINAIAMSPDGKLLAIARQGEVELLALTGRKTREKFSGLRGSVNGVAFSRDGKLLVAAAGEPGLFGEATIFPADGANSLPVTFRGHKDSLYAAALSPDGTILATGGYDSAIKLWNVKEVKELRTLEGHNGAVFELAFRPDGKVLASASGDRTVKLWNVATGERLDTLKESQKELYTLAFSPDGSRLAAAGVDNRIRVWRVTPVAKEGSNPLLESVFAHETPVLRLVWSADGRTIATCGEDRLVKLWNADTLTIRQTLPKQSDWASGLAISAKADSLAVGRIDGSLEAYPLAATAAANEQPLVPLAETPPPVDYGPQPAVDALPKVAEAEPNDLPGQATPISAPGIATAKISVDHDLFRFAAISEQVTRLLGAPVDLVVEPARNPRMQAQIDRDRLRVY